MSDISYPLKSSTGSYFPLVSDSVGITSSCLLLAFPLLVVSTLPLLLSIQLELLTVLD